MAAPSSGGIQYVGTTAAPISLGAAVSVWTWNHNQRRRAAVLQVLDCVDRCEVPGVRARQPSVNQIVLERVGDEGIGGVVLRVTWEDQSRESVGTLPPSVGVVSQHAAKDAPVLVGESVEPA